MPEPLTYPAEWNRPRLWPTITIVVVSLVAIIVAIVLFLSALWGDDAPSFAEQAARGEASHTLSPSDYAELEMLCAQQSLTADEAVLCNEGYTLDTSPSSHP